MQLAGSYIQILILIICAIATFSRKKPEEKSVPVVKCKSQLNYLCKEEKSVMNKRVGLFVRISLLVGMSAIFWWINEERQTACKNFIVNITEVEGVLIAYVAMVITVLIFFVNLSPREYYLTITKSDVIKCYNLYGIYMGMGISSFISIICTLILQQFDWNNVGFPHPVFVCGM